MLRKLNLTFYYILSQNSRGEKQVNPISKSKKMKTVRTQLLFDYEGLKVPEMLQKKTEGFISFIAQIVMYYIITYSSWRYVKKKS